MDFTVFGLRAPNFWPNLITTGASAIFAPRERAMARSSRSKA